MYQFNENKLQIALRYYLRGNYEFSDNENYAAGKRRKLQNIFHMIKKFIVVSSRIVLCIFQKHCISK